MRIILILFIVFFNAQVSALERVIHGYTPFMLSDLIPELKSQDRALFNMPSKGWIDLGEHLTAEELHLYALSAQQAIWIDICEPADKQALVRKLSKWFTQQPWSRGLKISRLGLGKQKLCQEWNLVEQFALQTPQSMSQHLKLRDTENPARVLDIVLSAEYLTWMSEYPLAANVLLRPENLVAVWQPLMNANLADVSLDVALNWRTRQSIAAGQRITRNMLLQAACIESGEQITAVLMQGQLMIDVAARALGRGNIGEQIMVLVEGASTPVSGQIVKKGVVRIGT